jgi:hypothetical protein
MGGVASVLVIVCVGLLGCSSQLRRAQRHPGTQAAMVQIRLSRTSVPIPAGFFGIGVEVRELPQYARAGAVFRRAVSLMRPGLEASIPMRVGGYSADQAYWQAVQRPPISGVFRIGQGWMRDLARVARQMRAQVTLAANLAVHSPAMAAAFIRAASRALTPARLAGVVFGDEPDLYGREPWLASERVSSTITPKGNWTSHFSPADYRRLFRAYGRAVRRAVPGVSLSGPELANLATGWLRSLDGLGALRPNAITVHRYPTRCRPLNSPGYPTVSLLLSEGASSGLAKGLGSAITIAREQRLPLVVSEMNSASCSGPPGVTDSFATALWAPDALFEMIRAGVHAVDWHLRPYRLNSPFELKRGGIVPMPELYGLSLFARMLEPQARLLGARVSSVAGTKVKIWAVRSRSGTALLAINKGPEAASLSVTGPGLSGTARYEQLRAPSVASTTGVTLGGQSIGSDARWHGDRVLLPVRSADGTYSTSMPGYSAVLISWSPR